MTIRARLAAAAAVGLIVLKAHAGVVTETQADSITAAVSVLTALAIAASLATAAAVGSVGIRYAPPFTVAAALANACTNAAEFARSADGVTAAAILRIAL